MEKLLKTHKLPKRTQGEIENLNISITSEETEKEIKKSSKKRPGLDGLTGKFYKCLKKN